VGATSVAHSAVGAASRSRLSQVLSSLYTNYSLLTTTFLDRALARWDRAVETALDAVGPPEAKAWSSPFNTAKRISFFHTDHLGSTRVVTDKYGYIHERIDYGPFGEIFRDDMLVEISWNFTDTPYDRHPEKYTGQKWDYRTGLYYYGARYYDPEIGRFTSADTVVPRPTDGQTYNRYSYVYNNPYKYVDPSGHNPLEEFFIGLAEGVFIGFCTIVGTVAGFLTGNPIGGAILGYMIGSGIVGGIEAARHGGKFGDGFGAGFAMAGLNIVTGGWSGMAMLSYGIYNLCHYGDSDSWSFLLGSLIGGFIAPSPTEAVDIVENEVSSTFNIFSPSGSKPSTNAYSEWLSGKAEGIYDAGKLTVEFITGTGPESREFGPGTQEAKNLKDFYLVNCARKNWYALNRTNIENGAPLLSTSDLYRFHPAVGPILAGFDPTEQFVGSINVDITPDPTGSNLTVTITNSTSVTSGSYHLLPSHSRSTFGPGGTTYQKIWWQEPINAGNSK
jgi:RHS repeat-associated protein